MFDQLKEDGVISTRGLKDDAVHYRKLLFDVNTAYFYTHGGYEFAKEFYEDAYQAAVDIVGGEQYILSAVMHADERNRAMSEALGKDVYHYHLHVVYVPVVEKQILWSKRCKDKSLICTVKETIMQVSSSKNGHQNKRLISKEILCLSVQVKRFLKNLAVYYKMTFSMLCVKKDMMMQNVVNVAVRKNIYLLRNLNFSKIKKD